MKLSVDYNHKDPTPLTPEQIEAGQKLEEKEKNIETTINLVTLAMSKAHPDGLDGNGPQRRMWGRLQRKLDEALSNDIEEVEIEEGERDMISKALKNAQMPLQWSRYISALEDALEAKPLPNENS